jgi:tetratricopeptide (TPR) repeat protein
MKTKITILVAMLFLSVSFVTAQGQEEDMTTLSIFDQYCKSKNYDAAFEPWQELRNRNPKFSLAIFTHGEDILEHKIEKTSGTEQVGHINDMLKMYDERLLNFASKSKKGDILSKKAQLMYEYKQELGKSDTDVYNAFDKAYTTDVKTFTNPKALYTYYKVMVALYDAGQKPAEALFTKYDEITEKVESEVKNYTQRLNKYVPSDTESDVEPQLSKKDAQRVRSYSTFLRAYDQISSGMDKDLGDRANCTNLVPLYEKNYEGNKNDAVWLQRAMNRLYTKECNDDPLFVKIVEQKNKVQPDANTAFYLGILKDKAGDDDAALAYYNQAVDLETDSYEKARILYRIAKNFKDKGSFGSARSYYYKALAQNPSMGSAYLQVSAMYATSANSCGADNFSKRAVFWLAAQEAAKAGRVDPNLKSMSSRSIANYSAKAPSKSDIFTAGRSGEVIKIGCWIGRSVKVPSL